jgi:hypothetical protein
MIAGTNPLFTSDKTNVVSTNAILKSHAKASPLPPADPISARLLAQRGGELTSIAWTVDERDGRLGTLVYTLKELLGRLPWIHSLRPVRASPGRAEVHPGAEELSVARDDDGVHMWVCLEAGEELEKEVEEGWGEAVPCAWSVECERGRVGDWVVREQYEVHRTRNRRKGGSEEEIAKVKPCGVTKGNESSLLSRRRRANRPITMLTVPLTGTMPPVPA